MTPELARACSRAVHVITRDGRTLRAGRATLFILRHLGRGWRWFGPVLAVPPLVWLVELGYWIVARNRGLFSRLLFRRE